MFRILLLACCLFLCGCLRTPLLEQSGKPDEIYGQHLIGLSRDSILRRYGPSNGSAKLSDGTKLMQYKSRVRYIHADKSRDSKKCTLRLWLRDDVVTYVDTVGDRVECDTILISGPRNDDLDLRR